MNPLYWTTVCFGKSEEMEKNFYSIEHHIDIPVVKLVFINTDAGMSGVDNIEIFNKYRKKGDRAFLCKGNYWTTPYRYAVKNFIPQDTQFSIYSECDIWFERSTSFFSRALRHLEQHKDVGLISLLTRYITPEFSQRLAAFKGYIDMRPRWGAQFLWHCVTLDNGILRKYYKSKHKTELCDGDILKACRKQRRQALIEDGRNSCVHFDQMATQIKYPIYGQYYVKNTSEVMSQFKSKFRYFDSTKFTEI